MYGNFPPLTTYNQRVQKYLRTKFGKFARKGLPENETTPGPFIALSRIDSFLTSFVMIALTSCDRDRSFLLSQ